MSEKISFIAMPRIEFGIFSARGVELSPPAFEFVRLLREELAG